PVTPPAGPAAPGGLTVGARTQSSLALQWNASSGATGYDVYLDGTSLGPTSSTTFTFTGLSCSSTHDLGVDAFDAAGNVSTRTTITASTALCSAPTGLVAAYSFDDGAGSVLGDSSRTGTPAPSRARPGRAGTTAARSPSTA